MKKAGIAALIFLLLCALLAPQVSAAGRECHWYFHKNKEHKQPPIPSEFGFAEQYGGVYIDKKHGDDDPDKVIYLTFDAGYENGNVEKVLNALRDAGAVGSFFVLSNLAKSNPELIKRMVAEGHTVCNHTSHHPNLSYASKEKIAAEIHGLEDAVEAVIGQKPAPYFRPPEGSFSEDMLKIVSDMGYHTVFWSFAYADWDNARQPDPEASLQKILAHTHNGEVLLLHPTSATNAAILPRLLAALKAEGYRFGSMEELCGA